MIISNIVSAYISPFIVRAKEMGYETHVYAVPTGRPGEKLADVFHPIPSFNQALLLEECRKLKPCGVVSACSDEAMKVMNSLLREMGIPCNSLLTEVITTNKCYTREVLRQAGLPSPKYIQIREAVPKDIRRKIRGFHFPLIAKPVDMSASRGVIKIPNALQLKSGIEYALERSNHRTVILEEYIDGQEYSGQGIAWQGECHLLSVTQKEMTPDHFVEMRYSQPPEVDEATYQKIEKTMLQAFSALKIEYGAMCPDFRIGKDGNVYIFEVGTRMPSDWLGTDLVPLATGYDYTGMVIDICCGKAPSFERMHEPKKGKIQYIISKEDMAEYEQLKREHPERIIKSYLTDRRPKDEIRCSADRGGMYIAEIV